MNKPRFLLGIDGGGSKTLAVVVDEQGSILGQGLSAGGNHQTIGISAALQNIGAAGAEAVRNAGLTSEQISHVVYGLAGADRPRDFQILRPALATLSYASWDVVCDTHEGLRIGSPENIGVVLVCGSGTNALGRNKAGKTVQVGGFGHLLGDGTSGSDLARGTFRTAMRSWEGREKPTVLTARVAARLGFANMGEVFDHYVDHELDSVPADLSVLLHRAAEEGDMVAAGLLEEAGHELGIAANAVIRQLGTFDDTIPIVLVGSVLQKGRSPFLLRSLRRTIAAENPDFTLNIPEMAPVFGSILLAMDAQGIAVTDAMTEKFNRYGGNGE